MRQSCEVPLVLCLICVQGQFNQLFDVTKSKSQNSSEPFKSVNDKNSVIYDLMLTSCVLLELWWDHIVPALAEFQVFEEMHVETCRAEFHLILILVIR